jgi:hypothetical protein
MNRPAIPPPRVLIVMSDQWTRALLRAALREMGYDAVGTRNLRNAMRIDPAEPGRGPVRLLVVDQSAVGGEDDEQLARVLDRFRGADAMLIAGTTSAAPQGEWRAVLHRPLTVAEIASAVERLLPLAVESRHRLD